MMHGFGFVTRFLPLLIIVVAAVFLFIRMIRRFPRQNSSGNAWLSPAGEARVFRAAAKHKGRLTVSQLVVDLGLPVQQAEQLLQSLVDEQRVRMEIGDNGRIAYIFPELLSE
ncbi:MAG: hypothetical protein ACOCVC_00925 [Spirochaeta sp.]